MIPRFAVVGHPNKGKSSIVATLAEDGDVAISDLPGTTRESRIFPMTLDGQVLYELIDTPGFQRPRQVMAWLEQHDTGAQDRAQTVQRFIDAHTTDKRFEDECELLRPILGGAGILYVVDGSKPYGNEYEAEMQILRWTGRPRMALINMIGSGDHVQAWRQALDQYFSIVRIFDAVHADVAKRFALLRSFGELQEDWQPSIVHAVGALENDRKRRAHASAQAIAALIVNALAEQLSERIGETAEPAPVIARLEHDLRNNLAASEQRAQLQIEAHYRHRNVEHEHANVDFIQHDLFSSETAELFGLSRMQLAASAAMSGAIAGGSIDVLLGGASLLAGAAAGALISSASVLLGANRLSQVKVLGQSLTSRNIVVGPFRDPNLPWILLGRALSHHRLIAERNHSRREALIVETAALRNQADDIPDELRKQLTREFQTIRSSGYDPTTSQLPRLIETLIAGTE